MSDFKVLVDKIINDAQEKKQDIVNKARAESDKIVSKKIDEGNEYKDKILKKAQIEGKELKDKIISKYELKIRNNKLKARRKVLDEVFSKALEELLNLNEEKFKGYVVNTLNKLNVSGEYFLLIPDKYSNIVDNLTSEVNTQVKNNFKVIGIKPSDNLKGGFILEKDGVFINYSFDVLVNSIRDDIEFEVSNLLFN